MRVLLTGMSGSGKSTLVRELSGRGLQAFDADDDGFTEIRSDGRSDWDVSRVAALISPGQSDHHVFFSGMSAAQGELDFDLRILLTAPTGVMIDRLRTRTGHVPGTPDDPATAAELRQAVADLESVEPLLRRTADLILDTTEPVDLLADRVVDASRRGGEAAAELQRETQRLADPWVARPTLVYPDDDEFPRDDE